MPKSDQSRDVFVSVKWLADKIASGDKTCRLLDATMFLPALGRNARAEYEAGHIPNAQFFDLDSCFDSASDYPHMLPSPAHFEQHVGRLGISNDTHIILYDNNEMFGIYTVERVWWQFRVFGHTNVSILDGGLPKWCAEGHRVSKDVISVRPASFKAKYQPHLVKSFSDIQDNLKTKKYVLVDSRPPGRFHGTSPEPYPETKPGSIPGSISMPFMEIMNPDTKTVKSLDDLRKWFSDNGVDLNKPLIATCTSGVTACCLVIAAALCGIEDVPVYDGSWNEWYRRADSSQMVNVPKD